MKPPAVTPEQLYQAFARLSTRPRVPATLQEALARPAWRICLHGIARNLARAAAQAKGRRAGPLPPLPLFNQGTE